MSRKIAFAGIFAGIAIVILYLSVIIPAGKLTLYFLASLPVAFAIIESGAGAGLSLYFAVCILSALVLGNVYGIIPFIFFFGHYPVFKFIIEKQERAWVEILLKLVVFNLSMLLWYVLFKNVFIGTLPVLLRGGMAILLVVAL